MDNKNLEPIKRAIVSGHQRGICNKSGESIVGPDGTLIAKPTSTGSTAKTYVVRNGKCVEK